MIMLNENIKAYRKQKGYTQDTLAQELNVVRQTVSKWEKGYSVPDAMMLERMAELFEVSVGDLLGTEMKNEPQQADLDRISAQLSILNNQFAKELARKRKIRKFFKILLAVILAAAVLAACFAFIPNPLTVSEPVTESEPLYVYSEISDELDAAISKAILNINSDSDWLGECPAESHFVYGTEENGDGITVYLLESFSSFGFQNGFFIPAGGHSVPAVYRFKKTDNVIELLDYEYAQDGSLYAESIKKMFPLKYRSKVLNGLSADESHAMWVSEVAQAQKYLESINRKATVCQYSDIEHKLLTDAGVPVEIDNMLLDMKLSYDFEIGNHEVIEDGKRMVYQTDYDREKKQVTYTKFEYGTGNVVEFIAVSSETAKIIKDAPRPEKAEYKMGKLVVNSIGRDYTTVAVYE